MKVYRKLNRYFICKHHKPGICIKNLKVNEKKCDIQRISHANDDDDDYDDGKQRLSTFLILKT